MKNEEVNHRNDMEQVFSFQQLLTKKSDAYLPDDHEATKMINKTDSYSIFSKIQGNYLILNNLHKMFLFFLTHMSTLWQI